MNRKWGKICAAFIAAMMLTACGSSSPAAQSSEAPESSVQQDGSAAGSNVFYDRDGVVMTTTEYQDQGMYCFLRYTVRNDSENNVNMQLYPMLVNEGMSVSEGTFETVAPGEEKEFEIAIRADILAAVDIDPIGSVKGYLLFNDENYEPVGEPELVTLYEEVEVTEAKVMPSENVIFDEQGVNVSYLGSFISPTDENIAVFLAQNRSDVHLNVSMERDSAKIDGKPQGDHILLYDGATIPPGKDGLVTVSVADGSTYENASFETMDFELYVASNKLQPQYLPIHMTCVDDKIKLAAEETAPAAAEEEKPQEGSAEEEMLTLPEALDVLTDAMIWRYEYGEDTYDSEYLMFMSDTEVELNTVSRGPFEVTDNGDGTFTIDAVLTTRFQGKESTLELQFILSRTDGQYMITPAGDYWMKSVEPDNPVWDNGVFLPEDI